MDTNKNKRMDGKSIEKYAQFLFRLRGMGLYTNKIMSQHLPGRGDGDHEQFLIACLVTGDEIWDHNTWVLNEYNELTPLVLNEYKEFLRGIREFKFDERFIRHGRVVVLLNTEGNHTHGEARLLHYRGNIRRNLGLNVDNEESNDYLKAMSDEFVNEFGEYEQAYLLMFSHYVPCTLKSHQCASLIGQYAAQSEHKVVVGYKDIFEDDNEASDEIEAYDMMAGNEDTFCQAMIGESRTIYERKAKNAMKKHGALVIRGRKRVVVGYKKVYEDDFEASDEGGAIAAMEDNGALVIYPKTLENIAGQHGYGFYN